MKQTGNTIFITGGGTGIGRALAHRFHDLGNTVIISGRHPEAMAEATEGRANMHWIALDIEHDDITAFAARLLAAHPGINVLINNAGIMRYEEIGTRRDLSDTEAMIATNVLGPIRMIDALVDHLAAQADAAIINVSSGLAFVPMVKSATYNASKAAIHSYTISLRQALKGRVQVIELVPPAVQTGLTPGQETREGYLPLKDFIDEVMAIFATEPTPGEILITRANFLRRAEIEGRFDQVFGMLNGLAPKA